MPSDKDEIGSPVAKNFFCLASVLDQANGPRGDAGFPAQQLSRRNLVVGVAIDFDWGNAAGTAVNQIDALRLHLARVINERCRRVAALDIIVTGNADK